MSHTYTVFEVFLRLKMWSYRRVYTVFHVFSRCKCRFTREYIRYLRYFEVENVDLYASIYAFWVFFTFKMSSYTRVYTLFEVFCACKCPLMQYYIRYLRFSRLQNVHLHTSIYGIWGRRGWEIYEVTGDMSLFSCFYWSIRTLHHICRQN